MFYHKLMVYRVRSAARIRGHRPRKQHPLLSLTTLSTLGLCATAIYASLGGWDNTQNKNRAESGLVWEFATMPDAQEHTLLPSPSAESALDTLLGLEHNLGLEYNGQQPPNAELDPDIHVIPAAPRSPPIGEPPAVTQRLPQPAPQPQEASATQATEQQAASETATEEAAAGSAGAIEEGLASAIEEDRWRETKIRKGDSISLLFSRLELPASLLHRIVNSSDEAARLAHIRPGQVLRVKLNSDDQFEQLILERNTLQSLQIIASEKGFEATLTSKPIEARSTQVSGIINGSFYGSAKRLGLSDAAIMELVEIFGWDIDFALEIQRGDSFAVVLEELYVEGQRYRSGNILAAEFINRGRVYRALRYEMPDGEAEYFTPEGNSMRKAFLRAPVDFRRISSSFSTARYHPVLGERRPHRGVDYAAPTGTPIKAAGDGRVIVRGEQGGYGNTVIIQHGERYTTLYAHMSKFHPDVRQNSRVRQGDIIGYVGATGLATGPHLHYEFRIDGVHKDPVTVELPKALPIDRQYRQDFLAKAATKIAQLDRLSTATRLAQNH